MLKHIVILDVLAIAIGFVLRAVGGPVLAASVTDLGLIDEYLIYLAPALLGGPMTAIGDLCRPAPSATAPFSVSTAPTCSIR